MEKTFSKARPLLISALVAMVLLCSLMLAACGKQIKELQIDLRDVETTIIQGEAFDYSNLKVNVYYDDDTSEIVDTTSQELVVDTSKVNTSVVGTYTVTVEYKGAKGIFNVEVISGMLLVDRSAIPSNVPYGSEPNWDALVVQFYNETAGEYDTVEAGDYTLDTSSYNSQEYGTYWIKVTYQNVSFLLTGDASTKVEENLDRKDLESTVLKVGHHGSSTATNEEFLNLVNPTYAVISVGKNNQYEHPHNTVLNTLASHNITTYRTDEDQTIEMITDGTNIEINTKRTDTNG